MKHQEYNSLPKEIKEIIYSYDENKDPYQECDRIIIELNKLNYTAEYYLDGVLYNIKMIKP